MSINSKIDCRVVAEGSECLFETLVHFVIVHLGVWLHWLPISRKSYTGKCMTLYVVSFSFHFSWPLLFSVYRGLDSHHQQEQEAAITATVALCQYSRLAKQYSLNTMYLVTL